MLITVRLILCYLNGKTSCGETTIANFLLVQQGPHRKPRQLAAHKENKMQIRGFHGGDFGECRILGHYAMWLL
jgi:hypothetical protein